MHRKVFSYIKFTNDNIQPSHFEDKWKITRKESIFKKAH